MTPHIDRAAYEARVRAAAGAWIEYGRFYSSRRSASSRAYQIRKAYPDFEVRQVMGVISARLRQPGDSQ